jgi:hypothetical protein
MVLCSRFNLLPICIILGGLILGVNSTLQSDAGGICPIESPFLENFEAEEAITSF